MGTRQNSPQKSLFYGKPQIVIGNVSFNRSSEFHGDVLNARLQMVIFSKTKTFLAGFFFTLPILPLNKLAYDLFL